MKGSIKAKSTYAYDSTNTTASALKAIGWITIVCGVIVGFVLANQKISTGTRYYYETETVFNWSIAIGVWASAAISGTLFLGFAEVITLLQALVNRNEYVCDFNGSLSVNTAEAGNPSPSERGPNKASSADVPEHKNAVLPAALTICPSCKTVQNSDRRVCCQCGKALNNATDNIEVPMNNVYTSLLSCEKYSDLLACWKNNGMDTNEAFAEYTQQIKNNADVERLYSSDKLHVKQFVENLVAELQDRCN